VAFGIYLKFYLTAATGRVNPQSQIAEIAEKWRKRLELASAGNAEKGFDSRCAAIKAEWLRGFFFVESGV
jgi:hypothetical protein